MIQCTVSELAIQLNQYLMRTLSLSENVVAVSNLVGPGGALAENINNKMILTLCSVERDSVPLRAPSTSKRDLATSAPLFLNLYVMVAANFTGSNYQEGLRLLSLAIAFFNHKPVFDRQNTPDLDSGIDKLVLDIKNLTPHEMSNVWGLLGGRYLPSVLYRVRLIEVGANNIGGRVPVITEPGVAASYRRQNP